MNAPRTHTIYRAGPDHYGDLGAFGALIGSAFASLSAVRWLVPGNPTVHGDLTGPGNPASRAVVFARWAELQTADALSRGHVDVIDVDHVPVAIAVWFTNPHAKPAPDYDQQLHRAVGRSHIDRFRSLEATMGAAHPSGDHHHLLLLAVRPDQQNQGHGSALLTHHHQTLDRVGVPAYLEAASPESSRLYLRHGYTHLGGPLTLPGNHAPDLWPMWRDPQRAETHQQPRL
ncbi:GNAT family N-acetyltransferase [Cryptosporangium minutisporangium]|uniref:N-acetyltransferase domain-containing protein n=1 Tax=Cryptosporangium minutisporangium TaxID=113569 RepID=A0ABP6T4Z3_9ACTN